jgi:hypothetical protein
MSKPSRPKKLVHATPAPRPKRLRIVKVVAGQHHVAPLEQIETSIGRVFTGTTDTRFPT